MTTKSTSTKKITVLVADDHTVVRMGLSALLDMQHDMHVVGQAKNGKEAVEEALRLKPDVVIMDLMMPVMDGTEAPRKIREQLPETNIVILTTYTTTDGIASAIDSGACGAVFKSDANDELITAIRTVAGGGKFVSPAIDRQFKCDPPADHLSPRQIDILKGIVAGKSNTEIAKELGISPTVVRDHTTIIFEKLGVSNRVEAVAAALRKQLLKI